MLEVLEAEVAPDPEALERVLQFIESGAGGMNTDRDVKCRCLVKVLDMPSMLKGMLTSLFRSARVCGRQCRQRLKKKTRLTYVW